MLEQLLQGALGSMLGGGQGSQGAVMQVLGSLLGNSGGSGGLGGLVQQFEQAGLGQQINSWISPGQNMPISPDQLSQVFGNGQLQQMAQSAGMSHSQLGDVLSKVLPQVVDHLTPNGQIPQGGIEDALGSLSKMLGR